MINRISPENGEFDVRWVRFPSPATVLLLESVIGAELEIGRFCITVSV